MAVVLPTFDIEVPGGGATQGQGTTTMRLHVAGGEKKGAPVVMVFQEAFGVNNQVRTTAQKIADQGYVAIAPELFHRTAAPGWTGPYDFNDEIKKHYSAVTPDSMTADFKAIEGWVKNQGHRNDMMASIGFCMGGQASFLANAVLPMRAAACFYGGGIAEVLLPLGMAEKQHGPVQLVWGGQDTHITPDKTRSIDEKLKAANKVFRSAIFSDAPHAFTNFERPSYNAEASAEAWALTFAFFKNNLAM